jgi:hypothetical protein
MTSISSKLAVVAACAGTALIASVMNAKPALAVQLTWTLNNVTFDDGGTAFGTFDYNADTNTYSSFNISVAGGDTTFFPPFTYSPATSFLLPSSDESSFSVITNETVIVPIFNGSSFRIDPLRRFFIDFDQPLTNAGGIINVLNPAGLGGDAEFSSLPTNLPMFGRRSIEEGTVSAVVLPVPEPSSVLGTLVFGVFSTSFLLKRKQKQETPAGETTIRS